MVFAETSSAVHLKRASPGHSRNTHHQGDNIIENDWQTRIRGAGILFTFDVVLVRIDAWSGLAELAILG
jgi:hypothetical protein